MKPTLLASVLVVALAACEPEYAERASSVEHAEVTGGADPTALSGPPSGDSSGTIHHPGAGGNAGRPADRTGGP